MGSANLIVGQEYGFKYKVFYEGNTVEQDMYTEIEMIDCMSGLVVDNKEVKSTIPAAVLVGCNELENDFKFITPAFPGINVRFRLTQRDGPKNSMSNIICVYDNPGAVDDCGASPNHQYTIIANPSADKITNVNLVRVVPNTIVLGETFEAVVDLTNNGTSPVQYLLHIRLRDPVSGQSTTAGSAIIGIPISPGQQYLAQISVPISPTWTELNKSFLVDLVAFDNATMNEVGRYDNPGNEPITQLKIVNTPNITIDSFEVSQYMNPFTPLAAGSLVPLEKKRTAFFGLDCPNPVDFRIQLTNTANTTEVFNIEFDFRGGASLATPEWGNNMPIHGYLGPMETKTFTYTESCMSGNDCETLIRWGGPIGGAICAGIEATPYPMELNAKVVHESGRLLGLMVLPNAITVNRILGYCFGGC